VRSPGGALFGAHFFMFKKKEISYATLAYHYFCYFCVCNS
jgi:hypothetical protein